VCGLRGGAGSCIDCDLLQVAAGQTAVDVLLCARTRGGSLMLCTGSGWLLWRVLLVGGDRRRLRRLLRAGGSAWLRG